MSETTNLKFWQWAVLVVSAAVSVVIAEYSGLSKHWEDALVFTVVIFAGIIVVLRELWASFKFWLYTLVFLTAHSLLIWALLHNMADDGHGLPKLVLIAVVLVEGIVIAGILWRLTSHSKRTE